MDGGFRVRNRILDGHVYDLLVMNILKQLSTYRDNASFSLGNIGGGLALLAHIGYTGFDVMKLHHPFEPHTFGIGVATILGGMAAHQKYTDSTQTGSPNGS